MTLLPISPQDYRGKQGWEKRPILSQSQTLPISYAPQKATDDLADPRQQQHQPQGTSKQTEQNARLVVYDVSDKRAPVYLAEHVVALPLYDNPTAKASKNPQVAAQSELHALPNGQFLVLARDSGLGRGQDETASVYRHLDVLDVSGATDVAGAGAYDCAACAVADDDGVLDEGITAAEYCSFLDFNVNSQLGRFGMHNGGEQDSGLLASSSWSNGRPPTPPNLSPLFPVLA